MSQSRPIPASRSMAIASDSRSAIGLGRRSSVLSRHVALGLYDPDPAYPVSCGSRIISGWPTSCRCRL